MHVSEAELSLWRAGCAPPSLLHLERALAEDPLARVELVGAPFDERLRLVLCGEGRCGAARGRTTTTAVAQAGARDLS